MGCWAKNRSTAADAPCRVKVPGEHAKPSLPPATRSVVGLYGGRGSDKQCVNRLASKDSIKCQTSVEYEKTLNLNTKRFCMLAIDQKNSTTRMGGIYICLDILLVGGDLLLLVQQHETTAHVEVPANSTTLLKYWPTAPPSSVAEYKDLVTSAPRAARRPAQHYYPGTQAYKRQRCALLPPPGGQRHGHKDRR